MKSLAFFGGGWAAAAFVLGCFGRLPEPHIPTLFGLFVTIVGLIGMMRR